MVGNFYTIQKINSTSSGQFWNVKTDETIGTDFVLSDFFSHHRPGMLYSSGRGLTIRIVFVNRCGYMGEASSNTPTIWECTNSIEQIRQGRSGNIMLAGGAQSVKISIGSTTEHRGRVNLPNHTIAGKFQ